MNPLKKLDWNVTDELDLRGLGQTAPVAPYPPVSSTDYIVKPIFECTRLHDNHMQCSTFFRPTTLLFTKQTKVVNLVDYVEWGLPLFCNTCKHCSRVEHNRSVQTMSLTPACCVHSNVYVLVDIHWIRYLTAVDPILSTSSAVQTYHHLISGSVEIPLPLLAGNSSSIGKVPVPFGGPI